MNLRNQTLIMKIFSFLKECFEGKGETVLYHPFDDYTPMWIKKEGNNEKNKKC